MGRTPTPATNVTAVAAAAAAAATTINTCSTAAAAAAAMGVSWWHPLPDANGRVGAPTDGK